MNPKNPLAPVKRTLVFLLALISLLLGANSETIYNPVHDKTRVSEDHIENPKLSLLTSDH